MIRRGFVPAFLDLAYQSNTDKVHSTESCDLILEVAWIDPNSIPLDFRLFSLLESYIRATFLPSGPHKLSAKCYRLISAKCCGLISAIARNRTVDLQLLIHSNLLSTFFNLDPLSSKCLTSLINDYVKDEGDDDDRDYFLEYLLLVCLKPSLKRRKIVLYPIEDK
jgi:hypothetical protein